MRFDIDQLSSTEIAQFHVFFRIKKNIFWFQIPVNQQSIFMYMIHYITNFIYDQNKLNIIKFFDRISKSVSEIFKKNRWWMMTVVINVKTKCFDDVWMILDFGQFHIHWVSFWLFQNQPVAKNLLLLRVFQFHHMLQKHRTMLSIIIQTLGLLKFQMILD